jgi:hypothetical protein
VHTNVRHNATIDRSATPSESRISRLKTFGELIDLHIDDMCDVGKPPRRSKAATLDMLKRQPGKCNMAALDRERVIRFGRERSAQGAGPVAIGMDIGIIKLVLSHAAAVHGPPVKVEPVDLAGGGDAGRSDSACNRAMLVLSARRIDL